LRYFTAISSTSKISVALGGMLGGAPLGMKMSYDRQEELLKDPRFYPTPYAAHQGWVSLRLTAKTNWKEVTQLVRDAYQQVALKRLLKTLEK
jgi:predicted DNA-binding protein (MmcQ/YjbR family)